MTTYKLVTHRGQIVSVMKFVNSAFECAIPFDPANTDAAEFAKWLQDGNMPEAAEEGGTVTQEWVAQTITKLLGNTPLPADEVNDGT